MRYGAVFPLVLHPISALCSTLPQRISQRVITVMVQRLLEVLIGDLKVMVAGHHLRIPKPCANNMSGELIHQFSLA